MFAWAFNIITSTGADCKTKKLARCVRTQFVMRFPDNLAFSRRYYYKNSDWGDEGFAENSSTSLKKMVAKNVKVFKSDGDWKSADAFGATLAICQHHSLELAVTNYWEDWESLANDVDQQSNREYRRICVYSHNRDYSIFSHPCELLTALIGWVFHVELLLFHPHNAKFQFKLNLK